MRIYCLHSLRCYRVQYFYYHLFILLLYSIFQ
nr:MAG TPA: hypothetical protein [Caudoviricetes sp.]